MASGEPFWKQVGVAVAGAAIIGIGSLFFEPIRNLLGSCWAGLFSEVTLPLWWALVLWAVLILVAVRGMVGIVRRLRTATVPGAYDLYFDDVFFGIRWSWRYEGGGRVTGLTMRCVGCDRLLRYGEDRYGPPSMRMVIDCQGGDFQRNYDHDLDELRKRVMVEIDRVITSGEWRQRVTQSK